ncbi:hypothetical protein CYMTET_44332 [Cymbomonas tetramitiformis]|uniref:Uncharacterized protein n=1 Tax=Cymbomonas tetramitiformis TaxID=36881 RepID=A0AAE0EZ49_9CHLO|nr:hypothetical protein CYMTET_44332 [Cymbomonas tetramitiformis]|eukprot:gene168-302_t
MDFIKTVCDEAQFIYDPITAIKEDRLRFSIGERVKRLGKKETKQEFYLIAHYTMTKDENSDKPRAELRLEEPVVCYGNTTNLMTAWKSELYEGSMNRKMTFFTDAAPVHEELSLLYEEMYVKPVAEAWHITSPNDFCNRVLTMLDMDGVCVADDEKDDAFALKARLTLKQQEVLSKSVMNNIRNSAYSFERTEKTGKLDATYARRKDSDLGIIATLPVSMTYDAEKKRKFERRDTETNRLQFGFMEILDLVSEEPLRVEERGKEKLHDLVIHSGRDGSNACLLPDETIPDRYACVAIKHGAFYFKTETSFAPQKHVRMLVRVPKKQRVELSHGGLTVSSIIQGMSGVVKHEEDTRSDNSMSETRDVLRLCGAQEVECDQAGLPA